MNAMCLSSEEQSFFQALEKSSSLRFSSHVQQSWCRRRAVNEGLLTLSILRQEVRLNLLAKWMKSAESLLDFLAWQLPDPSAELAVCRFEQLNLRARRAAASFIAPDPACLDRRSVLRRGADAGLAFVNCEPSLLVAPGLKSVCRTASPLEKQLWMTLATPSTAASLLDRGILPEAVEGMLQIGALEIAC
jgi:hypothetical protein